MTDTLFEQLGGTYTQIGDYLLPDLSLPAEKELGNIGVWALRHKRYLKQHHKVLYYNLLTSSKPDSYLTDIEEQAQQPPQHYLLEVYILLPAHQPNPYTFSLYLHSAVSMYSNHT